MVNDDHLTLNECFLDVMYIMHVVYTYQVGVELRIKIHAKLL